MFIYLFLFVMLDLAELKCEKGFKANTEWLEM